MIEFYAKHGQRRYPLSRWKYTFPPEFTEEDKKRFFESLSKFICLSLDGCIELYNAFWRQKGIEDWEDEVKDYGD